MATKSEFSVVGLAHKLFLAGETVGYTSKHFNDLAERPTLLHDLLQVLLGFSEIKPIERVIDCDAKPFIPKGWEVKKEDQLPGRVKGLFKWDPKSVILYLSEHQKRSGIIRGLDLKNELAYQPVLPANVLDLLLANPHLIPEEWKKKTNGYTTSIFFWGTIYRDASGHLCVRCLYWDDGRWDWRCLWLDFGWNDYVPAALRAV